MKQHIILMTASILLGAGSLRGATDQAWLDSYNIVWDSQSADARGSMPIGGGNIGLNVWVEKDELLIYFGSPDSWSYRGKGFNTQMQTKLGRLRLKFTPVAWAKEFRQELDLASNSIMLKPVCRLEPRELGLMCTPSGRRTGRRQSQAPSTSQ